MDKNELRSKIYWLEDKLLRSKDFGKQLQIHEELRQLRKHLYSQKKLAI